MSPFQPNLALVRRDAAIAQAACVQISNLVSRLPKDQAKAIAAALEAARRNIKNDLESHATPLLDWDILPGEIKNTIYKLLVVGDEVIEARVFHSQTPEKRSFKKYNLEGQVLRLNKSIYIECLPLMLAENVFEISPALLKYAGYGLDKSVDELADGVGTAPPERAAMIRRGLIALPQSLTASHILTLRRLRGLQDLFIVDTPNKVPEPKSEAHKDWATKCAMVLARTRNPALEDYMRDKPSVNYFFVGFQEFLGSNDDPVSVAVACLVYRLLIRDRWTCTR